MEDKELHGHHHDHDGECGCEHEHHHEHEHEHDHEHEHEHEREHEHHHDHDHEHEHHHHDGECGCDHDHHDHDHGEECHDPNCTDPSHHHHHHHELVSITHHESAVIGALKGAVPEPDYDKAEKLLAEQMREVGRRVTELGGIIGHIKFVLTAPGKCGQISVTDVEETIRHFDGTASQIEGVAIVFAVEDDELVKILTETIGSILVKEE